VTQAKSAAVLGAATGRDFPRLETAGGQGGRMAVAPPPSGAPGPLPHRCPLFYVTEVALGDAIATSGLRGQTVPPMRRAG